MATMTYTSDTVVTNSSDKLRKGSHIKYFDQNAEEKHVVLISGSYSIWNRNSRNRWFNCKNLKTDKCFSINLPNDGSKNYLAYDPLTNPEPSFPWDLNISQSDFIQESTIVLAAVRAETDAMINEEDDDIREILETVSDEAMREGKKIMDGMNTNDISAGKFITEEEANLIMFETQQLASKVAVLYSKTQNRTLTMDYIRTVGQEIRTVYGKLHKIKHEAQIIHAQDNLNAMKFFRVLEETGNHLSGNLINLIGIGESEESLAVLNLVKEDFPTTTSVCSPTVASESEEPEVQNAVTFTDINHRELSTAKEETNMLKTENKQLKDDLTSMKIAHDETVERLKRRIISLTQDLQGSHKPNIVESKNIPMNKYEKAEQEGERLKKTVHDQKTLEFINMALKTVMLLSNHCLPTESEILRDMEKMEDKRNEYLTKLRETITTAYKKLKPMEKLLISISWESTDNQKVLNYVKNVKKDLSKWLTSANNIYNRVKNLSNKESHRARSNEVNITSINNQVKPDNEQKCILCKHARKTGYNNVHFNIHKFSRAQNIIPESCPLIRNLTVENKNHYLIENQHCRICMKKLGMHKEDNCHLTLQKLKAAKCSKCTLRFSICTQHRKFNESKLQKMKQKFEEDGLNFMY